MNRPKFKLALPDTRSLTVVRQPVDRFISSFLFYTNAWRSNLAINFTDPIESLGTFIDDLPRSATSLHRHFRELYFEDLTASIGLKQATPRKLYDAVQNFDLVALTERFDESLCLLADMQCWPLEDMVYYKKAKANHDATNIQAQLGSERLEKIRSYIESNSRDGVLYRIAAKRFKQQVHRARDWLPQCVATLRRLNQQGSERCADHDFATQECKLHTIDTREHVQRLQALYQGVPIPDKLIEKPMDSEAKRRMRCGKLKKLKGPVRDKLALRFKCQFNSILT